MIFNELNEDNFLLFAIKYYENPQAVTKEDFEKDLNHFKYIKRLLKRYKNTGQLKTHLLLNHFIILYNNFNGQISNRVAFAFTSGNAGIGTVLQIDLTRGVVGTITDFSGGGAVIKVFTSDLSYNVGGAGTTGSVGIGTTTLTVTA